MNNKKVNFSKEKFSCFPETLSLSKRGASRHLEMVIAFFMFFIFVTFLLIYIKPYGRESGLSDSVLENLRGKFIRDTNVSLTKVFLKVDDIGGDCFKINLEGIVDSNAGGSFVEGVDSGWDGTELSVISNSLDSFYVYFSEEYVSSFSCPSEVLLGGYQIGSVEKREVISKSKMGALGDYDFLKAGWGVPVTVDFRIDAVDGSFGFGEEIPNEISVFAKSYVFEVWDFSVSEKINKEFIFKVW